MSFMPDPGTVVRLIDGRLAAVPRMTPLGDDDRVVFEDGHDERIRVTQIAEIPSPSANPVRG